MIEFSGPAGAIQAAELCAARGVPLVSGSTGLDAAAEATEKVAAGPPATSDWATGLTSTAGAAGGCTTVRVTGAVKPAAEATSETVSGPVTAASAAAPGRLRRNAVGTSCGLRRDVGGKVRVEHAAASPPAL